jgi:hypothetical protein
LAVTKSLLQLEDCWITRLDFRTEEGGEHASDDGNEALPRVTWDVKRSSEDDSYLVSLRVSNSTPTFHVLLDMQGTFSFPEAVNPPVQARMIEVNAPSILYGVARGVLGSVTGFSRVRRQLMPSLNLIKIAERREKQRNRQKATSSRPQEAASEASEVLSGL